MLYQLYISVFNKAALSFHYCLQQKGKDCSQQEAEGSTEEVNVETVLAVHKIQSCFSRTAFKTSDSHATFCHCVRKHLVLLVYLHGAMVLCVCVQ